MAELFRGEPPLMYAPKDPWYLDQILQLLHAAALELGAEMPLDAWRVEHARVEQKFHAGGAHKTGVEGVVEDDVEEHIAVVESDGRAPETHAECQRNFDGVSAHQSNTDSKD